MGVRVRYDDADDPRIKDHFRKVLRVYRELMDEGEDATSLAAAAYMMGYLEQRIVATHLLGLRRQVGDLTGAVKRMAVAIEGRNGKKDTTLHPHQRAPRPNAELRVPVRSEPAHRTQSEIIFQTDPRGRVGADHRRDPQGSAGQPAEPAGQRARRHSGADFDPYG